MYAQVVMPPALAIATYNSLLSFVGEADHYRLHGAHAYAYNSLLSFVRSLIVFLSRVHL